MTVSVRAACEYRHRPLKKKISKEKEGRESGEWKEDGGSRGRGEEMKGGQEKARDRKRKTGGGSKNMACCLIIISDLCRT